MQVQQNFTNKAICRTSILEGFCNNRVLVWISTFTGFEMLLYQHASSQVQHSSPEWKVNEKSCFIERCKLFGRVDKTLQRFDNGTYFEKGVGSACNWQF